MRTAQFERPRSNPTRPSVSPSPTLPPLLPPRAIPQASHVLNRPLFGRFYVACRGSCRCKCIASEHQPAVNCSWDTLIKAKGHNHPVLPAGGDGSPRKRLRPRACARHGSVREGAVCGRDPQRRFGRAAGAAGHAGRIPCGGARAHHRYT
eukprot:scaffold102_cov133-Isochrysis_galbana.AAC.2